MVNLVSPGVSVSVTDESFYVGAGEGTVPVLFVATRENKPTPDSGAIAPGTLSGNANRLFLVSSQRELLQTFGLPQFGSVGGVAQNGNVLNEYGLLAAHSFLGLSSRAFVMRADVDLAELEPRVFPPSSSPGNLTYWVDLNSVIPGLFSRADVGEPWEPATVAVYEGTVAEGDELPVSGFVIGDIILAASPDGFYRFFIRAAGGPSGAEWLPALGVAQPHTQVPSVDLPANQFWFKTTEPNQGVSLPVRVFDGQLDRFVDAGTVVFAANSDSYYDRFPANQIATGTLAAFTDLTANQLGFELLWHNGANTTVFTTSTDVSSVVDTDGLTINGIDVATTLGGTDAVVAAINLAAIPGIVASNVGGSLRIVNTTGRDIDISEASAVTGLDEATISNFINISDAAPAYAASRTQPAGPAADGDLWYNPSFDVDILINRTYGLTVAQTQAQYDGVNDNGTFTAGVFYVDNDVITLSNGATVQVTQANISGQILQFEILSSGGPIEAGTVLTQLAAVSAGGGASSGEGFTLTVGTVAANLQATGGGQWRSFEQAVLVQPTAPASASVGDLWINTLDVDNYPVISRWINGQWVEINNADQTTPNGIVFADARPDPDAAVDSDVPDPLLFPGEMLLWNTRWSGRNVKQWREGYQSQGIVVGDRWVSISGTNLDGSLITGQAAVRRVIADRIRAGIADNEQLRSETVNFNLLSAPGFPELAPSLVDLNIDRRETGFVIADTPFDLPPRSNELQQFAQGLTVANENIAYYYPSALTTNLDGTEVVVPASHMMLRTFAFSDQVSFPWFAPAGFQRGRVTNALSVGYLDSEDEFVPVSLNQGQRDVLYINNINPVANFPGRGIVVMGQKTRFPLDSALDRVNVARLINFVRLQSERIVEPFLFEPNDTQTRNAVKDRFDTFLSELVTLRGVFDFLVVVDESNNTPARIDRNELWVDIAISPAKAAEFIYIPIRVRNTGADLSL